METDNRLLLPLLAVRMLGGRSVPEDSPALKDVKKPLADAVANGWVQKETIKVPDPSKPAKKGKPATKNQKVVHLTEEGERVLREAAQPEALAATSAGVLTGLRESLEADRQALRAQVEDALAPKDDGKLGQELGKLAKAVEGLVAKVEKLESRMPGPANTDKLLGQIERAFAAMTARLDSALTGLPTGAAPARPAPSGQTPHRQPPTEEAEAMGSPSVGATAPPPLRTVLRSAYERLCHFREFADGLVELPRLYHEARRTLPGLTVDEFHRELDGLWSKREVELHILNEVERASEPDKGIRRDDYLYYFVYWNPP